MFYCLRYLICGPHYNHYFSSAVPFYGPNHDPGSSLHTSKYLEVPPATRGGRGSSQYQPSTAAAAKSALMLLSEEDWRSLLCALMQATWTGAAQKLGGSSDSASGASKPGCGGQGGKSGSAAPGSDGSFMAGECSEVQDYYGIS